MSGSVKGARRVYWKGFEIKLFVEEAARRLVDAGFKAATWNAPTDGRQRLLPSEGDRLEAIFLGAQRAVLKPERIRGQEGARGLFNKYGSLFGKITSAVDREVTRRALGGEPKGVVAADTRSVEERMFGKVTAANLVAAKPEDPLRFSIPVPPMGAREAALEPQHKAIAVPPNLESVMEPLQEFTHAQLFGELFDRAISALGRSQQAMPPPRLEIGISADISKRLGTIEEAQLLIIEQDKQTRDRQTAMEHRLNELQGQLPSEAPKMRRVAFLSRHKSQFQKILSDFNGYHLPVTLYWVDVDRPAHQVFADYAICTSEVSHAWTGKLEETISRRHWVMGNTSSERCRDTIKLFLAET